MEITKENIVWFKDENPSEPFFILEKSGGTLILGLREYPDCEQDTHTFESEVNYYTDENFQEGFDIMNKKLN